MRRLSSFVLLLLFSLPLITPLLASTGNIESHLPACCRRAGAHHCAMPSAGANRLPAFSDVPRRCPSCPAVVPQVQHGDWSLQAASLIFAESISHPAVRLQTQARARISLDRSRQMRGPPIHLL